MFPGNRTHNLLRCWRNALPLQSPLRSRSSPSPLQSPLRSRSSRSPLQSAPQRLWTSPRKFGGGGATHHGPRSSLNVRLCFPVSCVSVPIFGFTVIISSLVPVCVWLLLTCCFFPWLRSVFISPEFPLSLCPFTRPHSCVSCVLWLKSSVHLTSRLPCPSRYTTVTAMLFSNIFTEDFYSDISSEFVISWES